MNLVKAIFFLLGFSLLGCETDPNIYIPSKPIPVVYAMFDDFDTTHTILITKSFGAEKSPADFGFLMDSLYFEDVEVAVKLKETLSNKWLEQTVYKVSGNNKEPGFFHYPEQEYFQFDAVIKDTPAHPMLVKRYIIDSISVNIKIPGYETIENVFKKIDSVKIVSPKFYQTYLNLTPSVPLLFLWDVGHAWSEIDCYFEFLEERSDGINSQWVIIQNTQYNASAFSLYRQLNITYDEFIREVLLQIPDDPSVLRRYLGIIKLHIAGGDQAMVDYMKFLEGYSDYNPVGYSLFENAFGFISSSTHFNKDSMRFDYETRQTLINENRLKKLRISPWTGPEYPKEELTSTR